MLVYNGTNEDNGVTTNSMMTLFFDTLLSTIVIVVWPSFLEKIIPLELIEATSADPTWYS